MAYFLAATQREDEAAEFVRKAADAARLVTDPARRPSRIFFPGIIQLRLGDLAGYRATCKALADLPFATASDLTKVQTIWTWCVGPDALRI